MVNRYCIVGWKFDFNLHNLVWKVSIYVTWCTKYIRNLVQKVSGAQKILICVKHIEKSYKLIFPLFPIRKYIDDIYIQYTCKWI